MALGRLNTPVDGDTITAANYINEGNNILNNPIALISPTTGAINFNLLAHTNLLPSVVTASSGFAGSVLVGSTAATPVPVWSTGAVSGGVFVATTASIPTWLAIGTSGQILTVTTSGAAGWAAAVSAGSGSHVKGLVGTVSSQTGVFNATQYVLQTTPGATRNSFVMDSTTSFTINLGTAGSTQNGRDVAGAFASTYVYWYAISTGSGSTTPAGIVSTTPPPTGPVLPSSYSAWTYLAVSPYTSASTTVGFSHLTRGAWNYYHAKQNALSGGTSTAIAAVNLVTLVPNYTQQIDIEALFADVTGTSTQADIYHSSGSVFMTLEISSLAGGERDRRKGSGILPSTGQQLFYALPSSGSLTIDVRGYSTPNGDG